MRTPVEDGLIIQARNQPFYGALDFGVTNDLSNNTDKIIGFLSIYKNIFSISIPVSLYNLVTALTYILRTLIITSISKDQNKFAAYSVACTAAVFLYSGEYIFDVMEGMISKECPDENKLEGGKNVGAMLQSAWVIAVIFSVPAVLIALNLGTILRVLGQDKDVCDNIASMTGLFSIAIPMQMILSANTTFLTCTNSKQYLILFSFCAAVTG